MSPLDFDWSYDWEKTGEVRALFFKLKRRLTAAELPLTLQEREQLLSRSILGYDPVARNFYLAGQREHARLLERLRKEGFSITTLNRRPLVRPGTAPAPAPAVGEEAEPEPVYTITPGRPDEDLPPLGEQLGLF